MKFDESTKLYSEDKELKIRNNKIFSKKNLRELEKVCKISEENIDNEYEYTINEIKDYNKFLYLISNEINKQVVDNYFKEKLKENFKNYKEIFKNHQDLSFENNYMEFLIKPKLYLFFKFNDYLNIPAFLLFNCQKVYEEFDLILESEIEAEGCLYDETDQDGEDENSPDEIEEITKRYNSLFQYISGKTIKKTICDIHAFQDGNVVTLINEKGVLLNTGLTGIEYKDLKDFYLNFCNKNADDLEILGFYFSVIVALANPERIIVYGSLSEDFKNQIFQDVGILKQVMGINTECYISKEKKPRI